jgi:prolyl-tRNA synthetase
VGIPYHATIGKKAVAEKKVEFKIRKTGERKMLATEEIVKLIKGALCLQPENKRTN